MPLAACRLDPRVPWSGRLLTETEAGLMASVSEHGTAIRCPAGPQQRVGPAELVDFFPELVPI